MICSTSDSSLTNVIGEFEIVAVLGNTGRALLVLSIGPYRAILCHLRVRVTLELMPRFPYAENSFRRSRHHFAYCG